MHFSSPDSSLEILVGIDVGGGQHSVAVGLSDGTFLDEFDIAHRPDGFAQFFERVEQYSQRYDQCGVRVAMEGYNGHARPLDTMIQQHDWSLYSINNLKLARFKEIFPAPSKSDQTDAHRALQLFQLRDQAPMARGVLQEVEAASEENAKLKRYTRRRKQIVEEKVRVACRLQGDLQAVCPGLLEITGSVDNLWFLRLITKVEALHKLKGLHPKTIRSIPNVGEKYCRVIQTWQKQAMFSVEEPYVGQMIIEDARRLLELGQIDKQLKAQCTALNRDSSLAAHIESIPGFGVICSATLAGEIGSITRFNSEASFAVYIGMANLDKKSGKKQGAKAPKHVNSNAKAAMMVGVDRHRTRVPESQTYYLKKRAEGKSHNQAIRSLGRHLARVIFKMLKHDRDYEERQPA